MTVVGDFQWIDLGNGRQRLVSTQARPEPNRRSDLKTPMVLTDTMPETWHPANGRRYTSKAKFRQATKDAGCVEFGTEKLTPRKFVPKLSKSDRARDIKRAIEELKSK